MKTSGSGGGRNSARQDAEKTWRFFQAHCITCHGPEKQKGKFRVDDLSFSLSDVQTAERWQTVLNALNAGEMPPEDEPQPDGASLFDHTALAYGSNLRSEHYLDNCPTLLTGGGAGIKLRHNLVVSKDTPLCNAWLTLLRGMGVWSASVASNTISVTLQVSYRGLE